MENIEENKKKTSPIGIDATKGYSSDRLIPFHLFYHQCFSWIATKLQVHSDIHSHNMANWHRITAPENTETNT